MPETHVWLIGRLGDHAYIKGRIGWRGLKSSEYTNDGPYLIAGNHLRAGRVDWTICDHISMYRYDESSEIALLEGDVILTKDGTIGRVAIIDKLPGLATINSTMMLVRARLPLESRYVFHYLTGDAFQKVVQDKVSGSSIPHIFQRDMVELPIPVPPEYEQRRIADILDAADAVIQQTETLIAKLKQIKAGLLHDLLTRGLDAHGRLRDPVAHPEQFVESPVGRIPREWRVALVEAEFDIAAGFTLDEHRRPRKNRRKYLRVANVQRGRIVLDDVAELEATDAEMVGRTLEENDLLVIEGHADPDEIGRCALVPLKAVGLTFQNHLFRLRCRRLNPRFAEVWLNSGHVRAYWRRMCGTSSGLNTINRTMLNAVLVPMPGKNEQEHIAAVLDAHDARIRAEEAYRDKLVRVKRGLMEDLLTGRVRVH